MTIDSPETTVREFPVTVPVTIQIDTAELLNLAGAREYEGEGYNGEPICGPTIGQQVQDLVTTKAAQDVVRQILTDEFRSTIRDSIREQVDAAVLAALEEPIPLTDRYGSPDGPALSLRSRIGSEIKEWATKKGDRYDSVNNLQKWLKEAVDHAFVRELKATVDAAKAAVLKQVQDHAAEIMAKTIADLGSGAGR